MLYSFGQLYLQKHIRNDDTVLVPKSASAHVALIAESIGIDAVFVGKLSSDQYGKACADQLKKNNIYFPLEFSDKSTAILEHTSIVEDVNLNAITTHWANHDLDIEDIHRIHFRTNDILHFGSNSLIFNELLCSTMIHAVNKCKLAGGTVSFAINFTPRNWDNLDDAQDVISEVLRLTDIVYVRDYELEWLTGFDDTIAGMHALQDNQQIIICDMGQNGMACIGHDGSLIFNEQHLASNEIDGYYERFVAKFLSLIAIVGNIDILKDNDFILKALTLAQNYAYTIEHTSFEPIK